MTRIYETLPSEGRLRLALRVMTPTRLAQTFAAFAGQFYDRSAFDTLAREIGHLYDIESAEDASLFRSQLDRRLCDRFHLPVAWDIDSPQQDRVA
jgi:hypothetical protein